MRNPKWHRDEIILALDLYFDPKRGSIDDKNKNIQALSELLNKLPIFQERPDKEKFRNANGVTLKLANFLAFDPNHSGAGMKSGSKLDKAVFEEFNNDRKRLHSIATEIKRIAADEKLCEQLNVVESDDQIINDSVVEGQVLYRLHKVRERNHAIVLIKKKQALRSTGSLACEVCNFIFDVYYGEIGMGFIECHHRVPLYKFKLETPTTLDDLALVCSNCHRMLHKKIDTITVDDLRMMIKYDRLPSGLT